MSAKVTFHGNLTRDPELKTGKTGTAFCSFTVGVRTSRKNKDGNGYISNFYECVAYGKNAEYFTSRAQKGTHVFVGGDLAMDDYVAKDGTKRITLNVTVDTVDVLSRGKDMPGGASDRPQAAAASPDDMPFIM